eukprot:CAMPEP_0172531186 /NCGR_PEP_ID=MMETSP1067-20121228/4691_1 /TAXON_ID=265564 ORGANISM="Thalassiosira punctigera, Strain Tpunct2005C2" /NCGR_SAMPLE_ID=MMETSP1067 /ASSEMBLY_ACC=CAM_ASM_000444 /LENGTH=159 /DNA_ID=CAMNT_0013315537 /DNA_START=32 /DNA_END=511 /DNA_ORIENTATION=-
MNIKKGPCTPSGSAGEAPITSRRNDLFPSKSEPSLRNVRRQVTFARRRRQSWAACDWEDIQRSVESFDQDDSREGNDRGDGDGVAHLVCSIAPEGGSESNEPVSPRPGSLLELILREDAPTISGCDIPNMRRLGSMHEKIIEKYDEPNLELQLDISVTF